MKFEYQGSELELFAAASNWKSYIATMIRPWLGQTILDVGAGIGANLQYLATDPAQSWVALEPDLSLTEIINQKISQQMLPASCRVINGTIEHMDHAELFDAILYIDVLEHIANDAEELRRAVRHLRPDGRLIVLAPAHAFLFSPFDRAVGHYRRYNLAGLKALSPQGCRVVGCWMMDSVGFFASLVNRLLLRSSQPSHAQIAFWDRCLVPLSRVTDRLMGYQFGKTALIVWQRGGG